MRKNWRQALHAETQNHNRTYIGEIRDVDPATGLALVRLTSGAPVTAVIPVGGLVPPLVDQDGNTRRSAALMSWSRFMPDVGSYVKVTFGPDNRPEIIGAATWGELPERRGPPGHLGGYAALAELDVPTLKPGEWDKRSAGNAYMHGRRNGTLFLAGGDQSVTLRRGQGRADVNAGLLYVTTPGSKLRFGKVKRVQPGDLIESDVGGEEFLVEVSNSVAPGAPAQEFYRLHAGNLQEDPLVFREEILDGQVQVGQARPYVREVDSSGNITEAQGEGATAHTITGSSVASFSRSGYRTLRYQAQASITLDSARVALGSASAGQPVPLGQALVDALQLITVPTALGPSGPPINRDAFPLALSNKVFVE